MKYYLDTETCGLHGPIVLLQYAIDDGPIELISVWKEEIGFVKEIIEEICQHTVVAFNLAFDWFHICQMYTTLTLLERKVGRKEILEDHIDTYALCEPQARSGYCLKPAGCMDLMLHARKGPYQSTMDRNDIRIRRVPTTLAWEVAKELDERIPLKDIYFARFKDPTRRWQVGDIKDDFDEVVPDFKDVYLKFAPSSALKALAGDALDIKTESIKLFSQVEVEKKLRPKEYGYAPFALAVGQPGKWNWAWPEVIHHHIRHWTYNGPAREYASDDVKYLQMLDEKFEYPEPNDDDSVLAAMVGAVRWKGFAINPDGLRKIKVEAQKVIDKLPFNHRSHEVCRRYLSQKMSDVEALVLKDAKGKITTKGIILEEIKKWRESDVCTICEGFGCDKCDEGLILSDVLHPAAQRAEEILAARRADKKINLCDKLLLAGRFHASMKVIGTLSSRMAGADGMNPQGIQHDYVFRSQFPLADEDMILVGGDFSGFEICLMDAAYNDPVLRSKLKERRPCHKCDGVGKPGCKECKGTGETDTKIHALFGVYLFKNEELTYEDILATKGLPGEKDKYGRAKNGVYAVAYGGEAYTLQTRVGIEPEVAEEAFEMWCNDHKVWGQERKRIFDMFCSMRQPGGIGTRVEWHEPAKFIESMFGFRRYFTLENQIVQALYGLANDPPKHWKDLKLKVTRRDREQTVTGAAQSAMLGAAFQVQAANMRAAGNHVIQSAGATTTKALQRQIWDVQPSGINRWRVQPLNVHDEIMCPTAKEVVHIVDKIVEDFMDDLRKKVPLVEMEWESNLTSWAEK